MTPVDQYIYSKPQHQKEVLDFLNVHILSLDDDIKCSLKWKVPYYNRNQAFCYLNVLKTGGVELNFLKGFLFNPEYKHYLEFRNRKVVGGIIIDNIENIEVDILDVVFQEALRLDG